MVGPSIENEDVPTLISLVDLGVGSKTDTESNSDAKHSSTSISSDFFKVNPENGTRFSSSTAPPQLEETRLEHKDVEVHISSEALVQMEESFSDSPLSTSQISDVTNESLPSNMSPTQNPTIQVMERSGNLDPNRIPRSIFSKPSTPTEWSAASNDSLFSIRIGNISLRNCPVTVGGDLNKPGELFRSGELDKYGEAKRPCDVIGLRQTSPDTKAVEEKVKSSDSGRNTGTEKRYRLSGTDKPKNNTTRVVIDKQAEENLKELTYSPSISYPPDGYETRNQPSCFPVVFCCQRSNYCCEWPHCMRFSGKGCCSNWFCWPSCSWNCLSCRSCQWSNCCCEWPHCMHFSRKGCCSNWFCWPSCSWNCLSCCSNWPTCCCNCSMCLHLNCSWAFCSCWKRKQKVQSNNSPYTLRDRRINNLAKGSAPTVSSKASRTALGKWCMCFSCSCSCLKCSCC